MLHIASFRLMRIVLFFLLLSTSALALTYTDLTDETVTIQWTNVDSQTQWTEVRVRWLDVQLQYFLVTEVQKVDMPTVQAVIKRPRLGHWAVDIRSCAKYKLTCSNGTVVETADPTGTIEKCSVWTKSDISGQPAPWAIYWKPMPVTGIDINDYTP